MKFKIDEKLPIDVAQLLRELGTMFIRSMSKILKPLSTVSLWAVLTGCALVAPASPAEDAGALQVRIGEIGGADPGSTLESSWPVLLDWYPDSASLLLDLNDIETYDWSQHVLTLTEEASGRFRLEFPRTSVELAFVMLIDGRPLYGGVFPNDLSAAAVDFPVMYEEQAQGRTLFTIRPRSSADPSFNGYQDWRRIDDPKIREILLRSGKIPP